MISTARSTDDAVCAGEGFVGGEVLAKNPDGKERVGGAASSALNNVCYTDADNPHWVINIDVDEMTRNKTVTLTVYNLEVGGTGSSSSCGGLIEAQNLTLTSQ